jgi:hypothetical protein
MKNIRGATKIALFPGMYEIGMRHKLMWFKHKMSEDLYRRIHIDIFSERLSVARLMNLPVLERAGLPKKKLQLTSRILKELEGSK